MKTITMSKNMFFIASLMLVSLSAKSQVDYSVVSINDESSSDFTCITSDTDYVCMPIVKRKNTNINWLSNKIIDVSVDELLVDLNLPKRDNTEMLELVKNCSPGEQALFKELIAAIKPVLQKHEL